MASIVMKEKTGYGPVQEGEDQWTCKVYKGELVVPIPQEEMRQMSQIKGVTPNYRLHRDPQIIFYCGPTDVTPLDDKEMEYLQAINLPSVRLREYLNEEDKKMKMGLMVGDKVFFKLEIAPKTPTASVNGTIHFIGPHHDSDGVFFGIEIQDQAYRGKGTSNGSPYFTCGPKNAIFVAMDKIIKKQDGAPPTRSSQGLPEPPIMDQPRPNTRSQTKLPAASGQTKSSASGQTKPATSGQPKSAYDRLKGFVKETVFAIEDNAAEDGVRYEVGDVSGHVSKFKEGDRVIIQTVKEEVVTGTVRWVGPIRVSKGMKIDPVPFVGIETDTHIDLSKDFDGANLNIAGSHGTKFFKVPSNHGRVFLPEQLVLTINEYTMQQQKDNAAKWPKNFGPHGQKETKQDDATEAEKKLAEEFGMTVAEYRRQQRSYVDAAKQGKDDRKVPDDPKVGEEGNEERFAAGGGMIGGGGRVEGPNELTDTLQAVQFAGPEAVGKKRVEKEGRALEELKSKHQQQQQENHEQQHGQHEDYQDNNERGDNDQQQPNRFQQPQQPCQLPRIKNPRIEGGRGASSLSSLVNDGTHNHSSLDYGPSHRYDQDCHIPGHSGNPGHGHYNDHNNRDPNHGQDHGCDNQNQHPHNPLGHYDHNPQRSPDPSHPRDPHQGPPPGPPPDPHHQFTIGSVVRIDVQRGDPLYGVVKWIGPVPDYPGTIAGVELDRPLRDCTDGTWDGRRFFTCPYGRGYFCPLDTLKQDTRYLDEGQVPAHMRQDIDNPLAEYTPVTEVIDTIGSPDLFNQYIGDKPRGIQGHHNSCYLDSTVFGLFALSDSFDVLLLEEPTEEVGRKVKYFLWKGVVNPLRKYGLARYESIMDLRDSLEEFGRMKGAKTDEKDPEEFLNLLFKEVLHIPPFLTIKRPFGIEKEFFIQLFFEIDPNNTEVPKTEKLIAQMFHEQNISFTRVPSKLLLQMPRFGKEFKMYSKIIPSLTLDVKPLMDPGARGVQKCKFCLRDSSSFVCHTCPKELFNITDHYVYYCSECNERAHKEKERKGHRVEAVDIKPGTSDATNFSKMELLSVICIETSHYVCYTRAGDKWLFHDSMADRLYDMYNVPRVVDVTAGLQDWIYSSDAKESRLMNTPARDIPEYVRRFTQDIYMCVYVNPDLDMYGDNNDPEESLQRASNNNNYN